MLLGSFKVTSVNMGWRGTEQIQAGSNARPGFPVGQTPPLTAGAPLGGEGSAGGVCVCSVLGGALGEGWG